MYNYDTKTELNGFFKTRSNHILTEKNNHMEKFESTPDTNNPKLNHSEMGSDVNTGKKLGREIMPEVSPIEGGNIESPNT